MEDIKLVKKITDWNRTGVRSKGQPRKKWTDEVISDFKKLELTHEPNRQRHKSLE